VHPGGIRTNIARNARIHDSVVAFGGGQRGAEEFDRIARTTPEGAARQILAAVRRDKRRALVGPDAKVLDLIARLPAAVVQRVMVAGARRRARG
jgi:short-subunit dehydrogenase